MFKCGWVECFVITLLFDLTVVTVELILLWWHRVGKLCEARGCHAWMEDGEEACCYITENKTHGNWTSGDEQHVEAITRAQTSYRHLATTGRPLRRNRYVHEHTRVLEKPFTAWLTVPVLDGFGIRHTKKTSCCKSWETSRAFGTTCRVELS